MVHRARCRRSIFNLLWMSYRRRSVTIVDFVPADNSPPTLCRRGMVAEHRSKKGCFSGKPQFDFR